MTQTNFKTSKAEGIVICLPDGATDVELSGNILIWQTGISPNHCNDEMHLPDGNCQLITDINNITEDEAKQIIEEMFKTISEGKIIPIYINYVNGLTPFESAKQSFHSLLTSLNIDTSKRHCMILKETI